MNGLLAHARRAMQNAPVDVTGIVIVAILVGLVCGGASSAIAGGKNLSAGSYFVLGFLLGPIGLIVAAAATPREASAPIGQHAVICPRCTARQNVDVASREAECWQCKKQWSLVHTGPLRLSQNPGWYPNKSRHRWWDGHRWQDWADL
ncbi:MAG TPA: hypothetical protein VF477_01365 [Mycobacterium sp.]